MTQTVTYAIGDVHGEAERLRQLHKHIFERHAFQYGDASIRIIHLGDYVDRGPDSCGVIETIMELERKGTCEVISLKGNHEQMLLDACFNPSRSNMDFWLINGGEETLKSYQAHGHDHVTDEHLGWLEDLPTLFSDPETQTVFVHAGIDVRKFPHCPESVRLWTRSPAFFDVEKWDNPELEGWRVVHGHTPTDSFYPDVVGEAQSRINLDTGAVFGGRLTAGIFTAGDPVKFLYA